MPRLKTIGRVLSIDKSVQRVLKKRRALKLRVVLALSASAFLVREKFLPHSFLRGLSGAVTPRHRLYTLPQRSLLSSRAERVT